MQRRFIEWDHETSGSLGVPFADALKRIALVVIGKWIECRAAFVVGVCAMWIADLISEAMLRWVKCRRSNCATEAGLMA